MSSPTDPYASAHASPNGAGDARPTALQIISDEDLTNKLVGKVMLVTGTSSGIGIETVRALHATGADVYMQVRDMKKGEGILKDIKEKSEGKGKIELLYMELRSFESVQKGVEEFLSKSGSLNVLVNNAGVRNCPESKTEDGFETQFGTNHLAHFLLFELLRDTLLSSSTPTFASRVVNVTSGSHRDGPIKWDNLNLTGCYNERYAYAQSKTANILMANEIERRYGKEGLHGLSVQPGAIRTGAQRYDSKEKIDNLPQKLLMVLKSVEQGAATTVWAAVGKVWEGKGGVYLEDCREGKMMEEGGNWDGGYKAFAFDEGDAGRLWDISLEMVGLKK